MSVINKLKHAELVALIMKEMPNKRKFMKEHDLSAHQYKNLLRHARVRDKPFDREALKRDIEAIPITNETVKDIAKRHGITYSLAYQLHKPKQDYVQANWPIPHYLETALPTLPDTNLIDFNAFFKLANYL